MGFLFSLIALGFLLMKIKCVPENADATLSKLENNLFIPALILGTFLTNFTVSKLSAMGELFLYSLLVEIVVIPVAYFSAKLCAKDKDVRKTFQYGLCFSNFGFMGNAVVKAVFPEIFPEYVVFTLVLWILIYAYGVPELLTDKMAGQSRFKSLLKRFCNPLLISTVVGMALGLLQIPFPQFIPDVINTLGDCMSPVAMILTGMTIAKIDFRVVLKSLGVYLVTALRLVVFPLAFVGLYLLCGKAFDPTFFKCAVVTLAMPLGLTPIVMLGAQGKDTTMASGSALVSHALSVATIPLTFALLELVMA